MINFTGREFRHPTRKHITPGTILHPLGDYPRKKAIEMLKSTGIHEDYIDDALKGNPYGAKVIDLAEYRWMRLFDEL
jgi:tRNA(Ile)-lysidine synthase TilS/MesJ